MVDNEVSLAERTYINGSHFHGNSRWAWRLSKRFSKIMGSDEFPRRSFCGTKKFRHKLAIFTYAESFLAVPKNFRQCSIKMIFNIVKNLNLLFSVF